MKRFFTVCLIVLAACSSLFAARYLSVPVDDTSYRIIDNASYRAIIDIPSSVRPYTYTQVKDLLNQIKASDLISASEREVVEKTLETLSSRYGENSTSSFKDILKNGYYKYESGTSNLFAGLTFETKNRVGIKVGEDKILDTRNIFSVYLKGDLFDTVSVNANIGLEVMKVNTDAYLFHDTPFYARANYWEIPRTEAEEIDNDSRILYGVGSYPELATTLLDGKLDLRFGTVSRNWGPADNNLGLSGSTTPFSGFEASVEPFSWFRYSVLHGSLASLMMKTYGGIRWADDSSYQHAEYDNMFSIHRIDLKFGDLDIGFYENNVWRKRFELSYLAPFGIIELLQNETGNYDNMIFGGDIAYTFKDFGKVYFAVSVDEISSLNIKHFFSDPRHVFAFQGGIVVDGKLGSFSTLEFQATYIPPFYGAHYTILKDVNPWGTTDYETSYVSGGKNIFYPVDPDTIEFKMAYDVSINKNVDLSVVIRDQMRSAQYAVNEENGTDVFTTLEYNHADEYAYKNPFKNIWKNTLVMEAAAEFGFSGFPVTLSVGVTGIVTWTRPYHILDRRTDGEKRFNGGLYNLGYIQYSSWKAPEITAMANIGVKVYI